MPTTTHREGVPLNIWLPDPANNPSSGSAVRRQVADRLVETYSPPDGVVLDLFPGRGEVLAAAATAGRGAVCLRVPPSCAGRAKTPALDAVESVADLAVAIPPATHLQPPRAHPMSTVAAGVLSRLAAPILRPGGFLVLGTLGRTPGGRRDPASGAVSAVAAAGLAYYQHLVVLLSTELDSEGTSSGMRQLAHVDLLVFVRSER